MNRSFALLALALACAGCKKKLDGRKLADDFNELANKMCTCRDKACADAVQAEMMRWAKEIEGASAQQPDERTSQQLAETSRRYGECMTMVLDRPPPQPPPTPGAPLVADRLLKETFEEAAKSGHVVTRVLVSYVRADGTLDPAYGTAEIALGKPKRVAPADDPDRPIGAPVPSDPQISDDLAASCPVYRWEKGARLDNSASCYAPAALARPRCSVLEVWKQAIEAGAPAKGLAVIGLAPAMDDRPPSWTFTIEDVPRDIHFEKVIADVCAPTLEKPLPVVP